MSDICDWPPEYSLRYSKKAKYPQLKISKIKEPSIEMVLPINIGIFDISIFLNEKRAWIETCLQNLTKIKAETKDITPGVFELKFLNKTWTIKYIPEDNRKNILLKEDFNLNILNIFLPNTKIKNKKIIANKIKSWLKTMAARFLFPRLKELSTKTGLIYNSKKIGSQKTVWGYCDSNKNINLNYKLLFLAPDLVDYIIIHELCHLKYLSHGKRFWSLVEKFLPDYKNRIKQLRQKEAHVEAILNKNNL